MNGGLCKVDSLALFQPEYLFSLLAFMAPTVLSWEVNALERKNGRIMVERTKLWMKTLTVVRKI